MGQHGGVSRGQFNLAASPWCRSPSAGISFLFLSTATVSGTQLIQRLEPDWVEVKKKKGSVLFWLDTGVLPVFSCKHTEQVGPTPGRCRRLGRSQRAVTWQPPPITHTHTHRTWLSTEPMVFQKYSCRVFLADTEYLGMGKKKWESDLEWWWKHVEPKPSDSENNFKSTQTRLKTQSNDVC